MAEIEEETPPAPPREPVEPVAETPATESVVEQANEAVERLEAANKVMSKNIAELERLKVEETLGGTALAGGKKPKSKEDEILEGAKKMLEGTGFEDCLD